MKKWILRTVYAVLVLFPVAAIADYTATPGVGATIFSFVCSTTKICPAFVLIDSSNVEKATSGNPLRTDPTGTTTQPVSATALPLPAGAATAAKQPALGTAGTPSADVISVQGVAGGTPQPASLGSGAVSANAYAAGAVVAGAFVDGWDVTQGTKADAAWVSGSGSVISLLKNIAGGVAGSIPAGTALIGDVNVRQGGTALSATNGIYSNLLQGNAVLSATNPSFSRLTDGTNAQVTDPCQAVTKINFTGSQTTGTQIIAGTSAKKTYICSIQLIVQAAEIVNIIEGTGSVCATGSSAVMGSTTAANGMSYAANGGFTQGSGLATVLAATAANADNVCITQSGSSRITYQLTYVQL